MLGAYDGTVIASRNDRDPRANSVFRFGDAYMNS